MGLWKLMKVDEVEINPYQPDHTYQLIAPGFVQGRLFK